MKVDPLFGGGGIAEPPEQAKLAKCAITSETQDCEKQPISHFLSASSLCIFGANLLCSWLGRLDLPHFLPLHHTFCQPASQLAFPRR